MVVEPVVILQAPERSGAKRKTKPPQAHSLGLYSFYARQTPALRADPPKTLSECRPATVRAKLRRLG